MPSFMRCKIQCLDIGIKFHQSAVFAGVDTRSKEFRRMRRELSRKTRDLASLTGSVTWFSRVSNSRVRTRTVSPPPAVSSHCVPDLSTTIRYNSSVSDNAVFLCTRLSVRALRIFPASLDYSRFYIPRFLLSEFLRCRGGRFTLRSLTHQRPLSGVTWRSHVGALRA